MRYLHIVFILFTTACGTTSEIAQNSLGNQCTSPSLQTLSSIVRVVSGENSNSSGVVIAENKVITVAHGLSAENTMIQIGNTLHPAKTMAVDFQLDLALLQVETETLQPIPISNDLLMPNEIVWAIGFPLARSQRISLGQYSETKQQSLYTTAHINNGASGGALLQCRNGGFHLAGVLKAFVALQQGENQYINIGDSVSVPAGEVQRFIKLGAIGSVAYSHTDP